MELINLTEREMALVTALSDEAKLFIQQQAVRAENECLKGVLKQLLGREPSSGEGAMLSLIYKEGVYDKYLVQFQGRCVGSVIKSHEGNKYTVTFIPNDTTF